MHWMSVIEPSSTLKRSSWHLSGDAIKQAVMMSSINSVRSPLAAWRKPHGARAHFRAKTARRRTAAPSGQAARGGSRGGRRDRGASPGAGVVLGPIWGPTS